MLRMQNPKIEKRMTIETYSFQDPDIVVKMLNILRVYYNYMLRGVDNQTPAMRIGLAKGVVRADDLFSYT